MRNRKRMFPSMLLSLSQQGYGSAESLELVAILDGCDIYRGRRPVCKKIEASPAPPSPAIFRLPPRSSPRTVCPPFDSWQGASAFNQPLSFDTSSVTNMQSMFQSSAFNQPLSFDTSRVTNMYYMFLVRSTSARTVPS